MVDLKTFGVQPGAGRHHEEIIYSLALLYNVISNKVAAYLNTYHLTIGKMNILIAIKHQGGPQGIRQVDISKHLIVTPSNMTKMLDKLEKEGLVTRHPQKDDRRVNLIKITVKGSRLLDDVWPGYNAALRNLLKDITPQQQKELARRLTGWLEKIQ